MSDHENTPSDHADFIEARLDSISVTNVGFILFLKAGDESRVLPIFIGANEAQSIALALNEEPPPRPMTHDLLRAMLESVDAAVTRVEITDLREGTFFGKVHVSRAGVEETEFDARPSDAIALAVRFQAPILVARKVFEEAAVAVVEKDKKEKEEEESRTERKPPEGRRHEAERPNHPLSPADALRAALEDAVREERYEEAARLRDELKRLNAGN